ncbi:MAG: hypothetical protein AAF560_11945 [Acidobacteriota bacterium]
MMRTLRISWACGLTIVLSTATLSADDVQVNTYTTNVQRNPQVAMDADGDFVVVWQSVGSYSDTGLSWSVQGQLYAADGSPVGGQFQANTYTTSGQRYADVAMDADGDFVVVWHSDGSFGSDEDGYSIQGRRYASSGSPLGDPFQVNSDTVGNQFSAAVALDSDGAFVVVWDSEGEMGTGVGAGVQGQRYASDGSAVGGQFQINTYTTGSNEYPAVAMDADGAFVVVWHTYGFNGRVRGQRYASDGSAVGGEFLFNTYTTAAQTQPSIAMNGDGAFVVAWNSYEYEYLTTYIHTLQGQRFGSDGTEAGGQFEIISNDTGVPGYPSVAMNAVGDFIVTWGGSDPFANDIFGIQGKRYASGGTVLRGKFEINTQTTGSQRGASVAADGNQRFIVTWGSDVSAGTDTDLESVQRTAVEVLFTDGFESGDTSAWVSESR